MAPRRAALLAFIGTCRALRLADKYEPAAEDIDERPPKGVVVKTLAGCNLAAPPPSPADYAELLDAEVKQYENSTKFQAKIAECSVTRRKELAARYKRIIKSLEHIVKPGNAVLDLGSACGVNARFAKKMAGDGRVVAVDIVGGWVEAGSKLIPQVEFYRGDASVVRVSDKGVNDGLEPSKFDVIYMGDSFEHIPACRKHLLWETIEKHSKPGTKLYIHIPSTKKQQWEQTQNETQYFEEVIQYDTTEQQARCLAGMELNGIFDEPTWDPNVPGYVSMFFTKK